MVGANSVRAQDLTTVADAIIFVQDLIKNSNQKKEFDAWKKTAVKAKDITVTKGLPMGQKGQPASDQQVGSITVINETATIVSPRKLRVHIVPHVGRELYWDVTLYPKPGKVKLFDNPEPGSVKWFKTYGGAGAHQKTLLFNMIVDKAQGVRNINVYQR